MSGQKTLSPANSNRPRSRSRSSSILGLILKQSAQKEYDEQYAPGLDNYELQQTVGILEDISYGYSAKYKVNGKIVTLKLTDLQLSQDYELLTEMINLIKNTRLCRHENIVTYYTAFVEHERLWTVVEPVQIGSCKNMLTDFYPDGLANEHVIATILRDVCKALVYLHDNLYIHTNVRADNIMITSNGTVLLGGLHQMIETMSRGQWRRNVFRFVGDPEWMAPEVISQATTFNERVDIYSLGITALELMNGRTPFDQWPPLKIFLVKMQYEIPEVTNRTKTPSKHFTKYVERLLVKNPGLRPSALALLDDVFIKGAKNAHYIESHLLKRMGSSTVTADEEAISPVSIRTNIEENLVGKLQKQQQLRRMSIDRRQQQANNNYNLNDDQKNVHEDGASQQQHRDFDVPSPIAEDEDCPRVIITED